jgi:hypothetical protein
VEVAWEARTTAEHAIAGAEVAAAAAIERLVQERLAVKDVAQLTGLDQATVRGLRQTKTDGSDVSTSGEGAGTELV